MILKKINQKEFDKFLDKIKVKTPEYINTYKDLIKESKTFIKKNTDRIFKRENQEVNLNDYVQNFITENLNINNIREHISTENVS